MDCLTKLALGQLWNNGANCYRGITIQAYGKQVNAAIVDLVGTVNCKRVVWVF
jgi:hypothetical protein